MKLKNELGDTKAFRCCFCCHVRVGTIILGLWHLMIHILVLGCLITSSLHPELLQNEQGKSMDTDSILLLENNGDRQESTGPVFEIQYENPRVRKADLCFAFALVLCTFLIALMMVYGAVKNRPGYLIPFFCLQVFDFCITCLTVVGYMTYAPDIKLWLVQQRMSNYPGMESMSQSMDSLLQMDEQWLMLLFVIIFFLVLSVKAYFINMVWSCYKYIQMRNASRSVVREYHVDPDTEMLLPPKYEDAVKMSHEGAQPPPYTE